MVEAQQRVKVFAEPAFGDSPSIPCHLFAGVNVSDLRHAEVRVAVSAYAFRRVYALGGVRADGVDPARVGSLPDSQVAVRHGVELRAFFSECVALDAALAL